VTLTTHGWWIPGSPNFEEERDSPLKMRCGSVHFCKTCKAEAQAYYDRHKKEEPMTEFINHNAPEYTSRPERIEANLLTAENGENLARWTGGVYDPDEGALRYPTIEGTGLARVEDERYIIKDLSTGRFRDMYVSTFEERYQRQGSGDSGDADEYKGMQFESEEDLQAHTQRRSPGRWVL